MKINMISIKLVFSLLILFNISQSLAAPESESPPSNLNQRSILDWNALTNVISGNFKELEICVFLDDLAKVTKMKIRYRLDCKSKISYQFTDLPLEEALAKILRPYSYVRIADENSISSLSIYPVKNGESLVSNENIDSGISIVSNESYDTFVKNNDAEIVAQLEGRKIQFFPEEQQVLDSQIETSSSVANVTDIEQEDKQAPKQQMSKSGILEDEIEQNVDIDNDSSYQGNDADSE